ncbi:hypothetical protein Tco_1557476, partial [Tanacetum coccineum]
LLNVWTLVDLPKGKKAIGTKWVFRNKKDQRGIMIILSLCISSYGPSISEEDVSSPHDDMATKHPDDARSQFELECDAQLCKGLRTRTSSTNSFNTVRTPLNTASALRTSYPAGTSSEPQLMPIDGSFSIDINDYPDDPLMLELEDTAEIHKADFNNMEPSINVSPIPTTRIHSIHPKDQIIRDPKSAVQTRRMAKKSEAGLEELLQFKLLNVWTLVDLPKGKKAIGTKWVFRNKKDQRGIMIILSLCISSYGPSISEEDVSSPHDDVAGKKIDQ